MTIQIEYGRNTRYLTIRTDQRLTEECYLSASGRVEAADMEKEFREKHRDWPAMDSGIALCQKVIGIAGIDRINVEGYEFPMQVLSCDQQRSIGDQSGE